MMVAPLGRGLVSIASQLRCQWQRGASLCCAVIVDDGGTEPGLASRRATFIGDQASGSAACKSRKQTEILSIIWKWLPCDAAHTDGR
jgi:hypothetical protein